MTRLETAYAEYGMDYSETIERTAGDEELLRQLLDMFAADKNYSLLKYALDMGEAAAAFGAAHALKGSSGMLGMTRLHAVLSDMTELLRAGDAAGARAFCSAVEREYQAAVRMINSL